MFAAALARIPRRNATGARKHLLSLRSKESPSRRKSWRRENCLSSADGNFSFTLLSLLEHTPRMKRNCVTFKQRSLHATFIFLVAPSYNFCRTSRIQMYVAVLKPETIFKTPSMYNSLPILIRINFRKWKPLNRNITFSSRIYIFHLWLLVKTISRVSRKASRKKHQLDIPHREFRFKQNDNETFLIEILRFTIQEKNDTSMKYFLSRFRRFTVRDVRTLKTDFNIKHRFAHPTALTARIPQAEFDDFRRKLSFISRTPNKSWSRQILPLWRPYHAYGSGLSAPVCLATPPPSPGIWILQLSRRTAEKKRLKRLAFTIESGCQWTIFENIDERISRKFQEMFNRGRAYTLRG